METAIAAAMHIAKIRFALFFIFFLAFFVNILKLPERQLFTSLDNCLSQERDKVYFRMRQKQTKSICKKLFFSV